MLHQSIKTFVGVSTFVVLSFGTISSTFANGIAPVDSSNYDYEDIDTDFENDDEGGSSWTNHLISGGVGFIFGYVVRGAVENHKQRNYDQYVNQAPHEPMMQPAYPGMNLPDNIKIVPSPEGEPNCNKIVTLKNGQQFCELAQ